MKTMFCFLAFLILLCLVPFGHMCDEHQEEECSYTLTVKTRCLPGSGTKNHVRLKIGDHNGTEICRRHLTEPIEGDKQQPFQSCDAAKFKLGGPCFKSPVCRIQFLVQGKDILRLRHAILERENGPEPDKFLPHKTIPKNDWGGWNYCDLKQEMAAFSEMNFDNNPDSQDKMKMKNDTETPRRCLKRRSSGRNSNDGKSSGHKSNGGKSSEDKSNDNC